MTACRNVQTATQSLGMRNRVVSFPRQRVGYGCSDGTPRLARARPPADRPAAAGGKKGEAVMQGTTGACAAVGSNRCAMRRGGWPALLPSACRHLLGLSGYAEDALLIRDVSPINIPMAPAPGTQGHGRSPCHGFCAGHHDTQEGWPVPANVITMQLLNPARRSSARGSTSKGYAHAKRDL